jgi:diguanylate cyclase (GGDEF)-like protein
MILPSLNNTFDTSSTGVVPALKPPLILIVDDQPSYIQVLYQILKPEYEVCMATSGVQALEFCRTRKPDLILLDMVMPNMDGHQVCRALKADDLMRKVPVIFITAQDDPEDEARGLDEGAVDFISKPVHAKVMLARVRTHLTLMAQAERLRALAMIDGLSGVANRRQFDVMLKREWRQCVRSNTPLALMLIDIDFFKRYNDHYGHLAGDACIRAVASALQGNLHRPHDLVARYGGEEFACLLPECSISSAQQKANEFVQIVRSLELPHDKSDIVKVVSISVGAAVMIPTAGEDPTELIASADRLLYQAKQSGRNQACCQSIHSHADGK